MHAYLVMAHKNLEQIKMLLKLLDYSETDIYIHIDKNADSEIRFFDFSSCCQFSHVYQYSSIFTAWGSCELITCEFLLLKEASKKQYEYYHLISGLDLPLHSQEYIHKFFDDNKGKLFVHYSGKNSSNDISVSNRVRYYWFTSLYNRFKYVDYRIIRKVDRFQVNLQKILHINRIQNDKIQYHGAQWFSITNDFVKELLENEHIICDEYKYTNCCDEVFIQTYIQVNNKWIDSLFDKSFNDNCESIMRKIDWERGKPYTWRNEDYNELVNSSYLFARKFDVSIDKEIVNKIYNKVLLEGNVNAK